MSDKEELEEVIEEKTEKEKPTFPDTDLDLVSSNHIEESVKLMQDRINSIECWNQIAKSTSLITQARKEKFMKLGVYDKIKKEISEFARAKAEEIAGNYTPKTISSSELDDKMKDVSYFTDEEISTLKLLVKKVAGKANSVNNIPQKSNQSSISPCQLNGGATNYPKRRGRTAQSRTGEDGFPIVGSRGHRTNIHDSLTLTYNPTNNAPAPFSSVNILDINKEEKMATIEFTARELEGTRGTIKIEDLVGYENI